MVYAYDVDGHQFGPATTNAAGVYTLTMSSTLTPGPVRVELQSMPAGLQPSAVGTDNATTIRFVTVSDAQTVNNIQFAIQKPGDYCQTNPDIATTLFCVGNGSTIGATNLDAIWHSTYNSATKTGAAPASAVGSVLGAAWDPVAKRVFPSAYVKRHAGLKDAYGADGIYITNPATNTTLPCVELGNLSPAINVGQSLVPLHAARDMSATNLLSRDPIFTEVGKTGIGDIEANGVDTLYVTNLYQGTAHAISIPANGSAPTAQTCPDCGMINS